jgi:uncharacterized protein YjdB
MKTAITPKTGTTAINKSLQFKSNQPSGNTWKVDRGTINQDGMFTAPAGPGTVTVTLTNGPDTDTATVTVTA